MNASATAAGAPTATAVVDMLAATFNDTSASLFANLTADTNLTSIAYNATARRELPIIRGVEVGIVLLVLMVWAGAIALFFNRWGKIRMLLPYTPDYKHDQLKVPGGTCSGEMCHGHHSHQCMPRCGIFDRCFHCPRRSEDRQCGCQFSLLHRADPES